MGKYKKAFDELFKALKRRQVTVCDDVTGYGKSKRSDMLQFLKSYESYLKGELTYEQLHGLPEKE